MPVTSAYRPEPRFFDLGAEFGDPVQAADFPETRLRYRNDRAAASVGLEGLSDPEWIAAFGRFQPLPGQPGPLAMRYHGHQFRTYNPDLGDGRGFLAAQLRERPQAASARGASDRGNKKKSGPSPSTLRHAVKKAEERMAQLTAEIARIDDDMATASVSNPKALEGLTRARAKTEADLAAAEAAWVAAEEALAEVA